MTETMSDGAPAVKARRGDPCTIAGCGKPILGRGWCSMHYARWQRYGDPLHETRRYVRQGETCTAEEGCAEPVHGLDLCKKHYRRMTVYGETTKPRERRFWAKIDKNGPVPAHRPGLGPCWIYTGYIDRKTGYGQFGGGKGTNLPHRIAYQYTVGPIGKGLHIDHLCRVRACCNPAHLEPVTPRENIRRGDQGAFWGYVPEVLGASPVQAALAICANGCAKPPYKRDLCRPCYRRWLKDPAVERPSKRTPERRFWMKVDKGGPVPQHRPDLGRCWLWTASVNQNTGYGQFARRRGHPVDAHRFSYELAHGSIPEKHDVHHACHVRHCVNPAHLEAATRAENLRMRKNRRQVAA